MASESVVATQNDANYKTITDNAIGWFDLARGGGVKFDRMLDMDALSHQRVINGMREMTFMTAAKLLLEIDPAQAASILKMQTGDDLAQQIVSKLASLASSQQQAKVAGATPPETGKPTG